MIRYVRRYRALREFAHIDGVRVAWWETNARVMQRLFDARLRALTTKLQPRKRPDFRCKTL